MRILFMVLTTIAFAVPAQAQDCHVGVYTEAEGLFSYGSVDGFALGPVSVYVVARVENFINAVAYRLEIETQIFNSTVVLGRLYGPEGNGLNITTPGGDNVGLGECAIGFGQYPILVEELVLFQPQYWPGDSVFIKIFPNPDSGETVVYSSCQSVISPCTTSNLYLYGVGTESKSWGQIKSLY